MTKNSSDSQMTDFLKNLETKSIGSLVRDSKEGISFAGNSSEIKADQVLEKSDFEKLATSSELNGKSLLDGALQIFRKKFFSFLRVNLVITASFLLLTLGLLLKWGAVIDKFSVGFLNSLPFLHDLGLVSVLPVVTFALFWLFFSYLRASYLTVVSNYFCVNENFKPLSFGLKKLFSFIVIEVMQTIIFLTGLIVIVLAPFFSARYFLSLPTAINQNESAINAMLESREYVGSHTGAVMRCMFFISFLTLIMVGTCALITNIFIDNRTIYFVTNFLLFSILFLPLHSCYRFLIYAKLSRMTGELEFKISFGKKIWFVFSRLAFLLLIIFNIWLAKNGVFNGIIQSLWITMKS